MHRPLLFLLALFLTVSGCDLFSSDDGEFDLTLTGDITRMQEGGSAHFGSAGVSLRSDAAGFSTSGTRMRLDWRGSGLPDSGTYPVVGPDADATGAFAVSATLETETLDVLLDATTGQVTVTRDGDRLDGTAEFSMAGFMAGSPESVLEVDARLSFRAVRN